MFKRKKAFVTITLVILILVSIVSFPIIYSITEYLSKTSRAGANILLVEGWLPDYAIEMSYAEFNNNTYDHIITTGIRFSRYYQVSMNGYLIFYTHDILHGSDTDEDHIIEINAYSELDENESAHFNVFLNDTLVSGFFAERKKRLYQIAWKGKLSKIDSVMVQFDNDRVFEQGDRNLYVKEIIFDHKIHIPWQYNSDYDAGDLDGRRRLNNNFSSHAELARDKLMVSGLDSLLIIAIPGQKVRINRTLSSALAIRDWLKTSEIEVKGINIVTLGTHARRTWMTYDKVLDANYEIGIISLPDYKENSSGKYKVLKTLRESFVLVYYWFILLFY